ncbi:acetyl-CoA carboxylase biotin carboxyl carrier protein subunit [Variovorax sp. PBL-H6]|uniref:acetyl-CoA carboxylase biotin carboxyl carrier protein n=1 Tax=Variovorax sp. PBL-H6 TaxID=434009 RepID=UPI001317BF92|nr:acetyl-CoA carboxylase biotin carboxyl carrier protein subunit [Variovorax sp. PBL-H6]VTU23664.1 acetyl-CoA carboxylase biotin carboxyl carrier protein subunit [Variovorax sp. PBL-H6]
MKKAPDELREIAGWMAAADIGFLELRMPEGTFRLARRGHDVVALEGCPHSDARLDHPTAARACADSPPVTAIAASVGVFLRAHPDASSPFVREGLRVQAGQILGLLRIGVLLLPVTAPRAGKVSALHVEDCAPVGYGAALVDLDPF